MMDSPLVFTFKIIPKVKLIKENYYLIMFYKSFIMTDAPYSVVRAGTRVMMPVFKS